MKLTLKLNEPHVDLEAITLLSIAKDTQVEIRIFMRLYL